MSFLNNILNSIRLNQDEDYDDLDDDYGFEENEDAAPRKAGLFSRKSERQDDYDDREDDGEARPRIFSRQKPVPISSARRAAMEVTMIKPTSIEDSREICDYLLSGKAVVLNMEGLHMEVAQRIIDFTSGSTYSMDGNLQKISSYIFIATPHNVELSGDFQNMLSGAGNLDISGLNIRV